MQVPFHVRVRAYANRARKALAAYVDRALADTGAYDLAIFGAYNTSNIGDLCFLHVLREGCRRAGIRHRFFNLDRIHEIRTGVKILGGGGGMLSLKDSSPLRLVMEARGDSAGLVGFMGVSGHLLPGELTAPVRDFISRSPLISVRSHEDLRFFRDTLGFSQVGFQPDLAFSLPGFFEVPAPAPSGILGINITPFLFHDHGSRFVASGEVTPWFWRHFPEVAPQARMIALKYAALVRKIAEVHVSAGWKVIHVPFAIEDDVLARLVFAGTGVAFAPYRNDPFRLLGHIGRCCKFVASRFHSHVFSFIQDVPVVSLAYSPKCSNLFGELELPPELSLDVTQMLNVDTQEFAMRTLASDGALPGKSVIADLQKQSQAMVLDGLKRFMCP